MRVVIISGSPRQNSVTQRVALHLEKALQNTDHEIDLIDLRESDLPPIESVFSNVNDAPPEHRLVADRMFNEDAFILVTPEYNGS